MIWDQPLTTGSPVQRGPFGYYEVHSNVVEPSKGFITQGNVQSTNVVFVQDTWSVSNRLTVNLGIRTESENVPAYTTDPAVPESASSSDWATRRRRAPASPMTSRAMAGRSSTARGASSTTSSSSTCRAARSAATSGSRYYYTLDNPDYPTLLDRAACPPACPGTFLRSTSISACRRSGRTRSRRT